MNFLEKNIKKIPFLYAFSFGQLLGALLKRRWVGQGDDKHRVDKVKGSSFSFLI